MAIRSLFAYFFSSCFFRAGFLCDSPELILLRSCSFSRWRSRSCTLSRDHGSASPITACPVPCAWCLSVSPSWARMASMSSSCVAASFVRPSSLAAFLRSFFCRASAARRSNSCARSSSAAAFSAAAALAAFACCRACRSACSARSSAAFRDASASSSACNTGCVAALFKTSGFASFKELPDSHARARAACPAAARDDASGGEISRYPSAESSKPHSRKKSTAPTVETTAA
mmetsp:Transcript_8441/g.20878  ORF Transcript_8441/g.20878 Transcript_8441/m.20878 type:complete len:231 (+) Transcript_8441:314-1006(+)